MADDCLQPLLETAAVVEIEIERLDSLPLQLDCGRRQILHVVEIPKDGSFGDSGNLSDSSCRWVHFAIGVEIEKSRDNGRLVAASALTSPVDSLRSISRSRLKRR